jgi:hypothetical protein
MTGWAHSRTGPLFSGATRSTRIITSKGRPQSEDADSAIQVPTMADAIADRNGNIIIDLI